MKKCESRNSSEAGVIIVASDCMCADAALLSNAGESELIVA